MCRGRFSPPGVCGLASDDPLSGHTVGSASSADVEDELGGVFGGLALDGGQDAGVDVCGERDGGVPELVLDRLEVRAGAVRQTGRAVPQVVQADWGKAGAVNEQPQPLGEVPRVKRGPVGAGEHVPAGQVRPDGDVAAGVALFLAGTVQAEHLHGVGVQRDGPATRLRFGRSFVDGVAGGGALAGDGELGVVEVDIGPPQPGSLPTPQPAQGDEPPQRVQAVVARRVQERD